MSAFTLTKRCCTNCASVNSRKRDEPSYGNGSLWNMLWRISDTGRDGVPVSEACAKISLICDAAPSFTIYTFLLVLWLSRTPLDYLTDVLGCLIFLPSQSNLEVLFLKYLGKFE